MRKATVGADGGPAATFGDNAKRFKADLASTIEGSLESVLELLAEPDANRRLREIKETFANLGRKASELASELSDADANVNRNQLKAQDITYKIKIEASRTAGKMDLANQMAELEASHAADLAQQIQLAKSGGTAELENLRAEVENLNEELSNVTNELNKKEEQLRLLNKERDELESRLEREVNELNEAKEHQSAMLSGEIAKLVSQLRSAEDAREVLEKSINEEVTKRVGVARDEMSAGLDRAMRASKDELEKLRAQLEQRGNDVDAAEARAVKGAAELEEVRRELHRRQSMQAELEAQVALGDRAYEARTEQLRMDLKQSKEELVVAQQEVEAKVAEAARQAEEKEAIARRLSESLSKTMSDIHRATRQSADECRRELESMAVRVRGEIDAVRQGEREKAQEQLDRLLDELSVANEKQSQAEEKLKLAEDRHKTTHMMAQRLNTMRQDEKAMRETLVYAAREVNAEVNEGMRLPDQFSSVLQVYQRVHNDVALITNSLDAAMAEAEITSLENANLSSKMQVLLSKYRSLRQESVSMRATLDWALQSVSLKTSESATLEKKLKQLIEQFTLMGQSEQSLRAALRRQHGSLHTAFHRVKTVEGELARAHGTHAEEREGLVHSALHALGQLRHYLGAVHALRPEAARPIDEALVVKNLKGELLNQSQVMTAAHQDQMAAHQATRAQVEATMARMVETAGSLVAGEHAASGKLSPVKMAASFSQPSLAELRSSRATLRTPWTPAQNPGAHFPGGYADATNVGPSPVGVALEWQQAMSRPATKKGGGLRPITSSASSASLNSTSLANLQPGYSGVLRVPQPGQNKRDHIGPAPRTAPRSGRVDRLVLPSPTREDADAPPSTPAIVTGAPQLSPTLA